MPPRTNSRHLSTAAQQEEGTSKVFLSDRTPYRFRNIVDNITHRVGGGDSLTLIAARTYISLGELPHVSAANLWWVIADFQPVPIHDPTVTLVEGEILILPSPKTVAEQILQQPRNV